VAVQQQILVAAAALVDTARVRSPSLLVHTQLPLVLVVLEAQAELQTLE
jgi:hypothetical protein